MAVLITCKYDAESIKNETAIDRTAKSMGLQSRVTLMLIVATEPKSNVSLLSARLMKVPIKMKSLSSGQHLPHYMFMGD